jgi:hypothetical protein
MQAVAHGIGLKAQADQVGRVEVVESLLARQSHISNSNSLLIRIGLHGWLRLIPKAPRSTDGIADDIQQNFNQTPQAVE